MIDLLLKEKMQGIYWLKERATCKSVMQRWIQLLSGYQKQSMHMHNHCIAGSQEPASEGGLP